MSDAVWIPYTTAGATIEALIRRQADNYVWNGSTYVDDSTLNNTGLEALVITATEKTTSATTTTGYSVAIPAGVVVPVVVEMFLGGLTAGDQPTWTAEYDPYPGQIVEDTNELQTDWTDGGRLDTLLDSAASATSEGAYTGTLTVDDGSTGLEGAVVNARRGGVLKASGTTDANGQITNWVFGAYTYDLAVRLAGYQPTTSTVTVSADAWTKTISMSVLSITAPSAASLCTVQFRVFSGATPVSGAICKGRLQGVNQASDGTILSNAESSDTTDSNGIAELEVVRQDQIVKGSGIYKLWVEIDGKPVASVETKIPNQATMLFEDLL